MLSLKYTFLFRALSDKDWLKTKAAIWCIANVCISHEGVSFIDREGGIDVLIRITETSPVLSLKATAFYALSLVATTRYVLFPKSIHSIIP